MSDAKPTANHKSRWLSPLLLVSSGAIAMGGVVAIQQAQLAQPSLSGLDPAAAAQQEATNLNILKRSPTFGFDNVIADWVFLQFLQYFGDTPARQATGYTLSPQYFEVITKLDPRFVGSYLYLSYSVSHQLGEPETAVALMERGAQALSPETQPEAWRVWSLIALDRLLLLGDFPGAIQAYEMAAQWAEPTNPDLANQFQQTAEFLRQDPDSSISRNIRAQAWGSIYVEAARINDKATMQRVETALQELGYGIRIQEQRISIYPLNKEDGSPSPNSP